MDELLGPVLGAQVTWQPVRCPQSEHPIPDSPMARCFSETWQIHKNDTYIPVYDKTFAPYRDGPIRMLEIGVSRGGSLELWRRYFSPESVIVGIDFNPQCARFDVPDRNIYVRIGDQQDTDFLQSVIDELGPFDIILDDGSHLPEPTLTAFQHLFAHGLHDGGVYLVEDLWFCYMPEVTAKENQYYGLDINCPTFIEVVKHLIDVMHRVWVGHNTLEEFGYRTPDHLVPLATTLISRIELSDSIVAIYRQPRQVPRVLCNTSGPDFPTE